ncbi:MAG: alcohol dehydrogenase catalytic domain-containing protein, partial [Burkholderiaceae bacterium]
MNPFQALVVDKSDTAYSATIKAVDESALVTTGERDVLVKVDYSTINYKDGLAITGKSPILRKFPMIPGIDFAGSVVESADP